MRAVALSEQIRLHAAHASRRETVARLLRTLEGLAPIIVEELAASLKNLEGVATVLVEQHTEVALSLTADALVIERGRIVHRARSADFRRDAETLERYVGLRVGERS